MTLGFGGCKIYATKRRGGTVGSLDTQWSEICHKPMRAVCVCVCVCVCACMCSVCMCVCVCERECIQTDV